MNDIIGKKFNKLTVLNDYIKVKNGRKYKCRCDCGNEKYVYRGKITSGHTKSCGCLSKKHGMYKHKLYSVWSDMKDRCYNPNCQAYKNYGQKGISLCDEWIDNYMNFHNWAFANGYKEGLTIDRLDSNGNYCPENCEWITLSENVARANKGYHRRKTKFKYYGISPEGVKYSFSNAREFAEENGLNANGLRRVARGERPFYKGWQFGYTDEANE